ncbi:hypothetical protein OIU85_006328 [Salix viminalis]|uniref:Pentatricopeptide repeat-containing protein n=1 Tax=Salix viminalis TaxID=40686 RepID=A0A9Q0SUN3_SALVM|nr:hypothetical protein OIU85_006328 [Salix viminalis]
MNGWLKKPILDTSGVAVKRWKWGLELETQLDKLQFVPYMTHLVQALKTINETDAVVSLFKWAKRQTWVLKYLAKAEKLEVLFCCFKKAQDSGSKIDAAMKLYNSMTNAGLSTYTALLTLSAHKKLVTNSKDCGCTDVELRRIPIEVSKVVLTSKGPWGFSYGVVRETNCSEFLLNENPSRADILMHRLNILIPTSAPEIRSLTTPKSLISANAV